MKSVLLIFLSLFINAAGYSQAGQLKSIVYDFDGQGLGQSNLPDGDYKNFDLSYQIAENPLTASTVLGDRVLKVVLNWSSGRGEFGKGITRHVELDVQTDYINFYCYNPLSNSDSVIAEVSITEDDNFNGLYEPAQDDKWRKEVAVARAAGWQLVSLPLSSFADASAGGNGVFDAGYGSTEGKLLTVSITFKKKSLPYTGTESYYIDMICFSEGALATGTTDLDPPIAEQEDHCLLGCLAYRTPADSVPFEFEALFPEVNRLHYINIFMPYATSGSTASNLPGNAVQRLINNGYKPLITWEMLYTSYSASDSIQPRLNDILSGEFDSYYDAFADKIKLYTDTVYIRLFHEFDGDWYPWCISVNGQDPQRLVNAFRYIVDRFRAKGAYNVKWVWSPNSAPKPNTSYNWIVDAYPGNNYVDVVATSIYNHPSAGTPPWKSFRSLYAECYFYLWKYFPEKPVFICEMACRERYGAELSSSQTKAEWLCQLDNDLRSFFNNTRALIFFNRNKEHDWRVNSSTSTMQAVKSCLWENTYYTERPLIVSENLFSGRHTVFPNPFSNELIIENVFPYGEYRITVYDIFGKKIACNQTAKGVTIQGEIASGVYILEISGEQYSEKIKIIKQ